MPVRLYVGGAAGTGKSRVGAAVTAHIEAADNPRAGRLLMAAFRPQPKEG